MSTTAAVARRGLRPIPAEVATALAETTSHAVSTFCSTGDGEVNVMAALEIAASVQDLRTLFETPEIKDRIVALQDSPIGFRTDKDPKVWNKGKNAYNEPYQYPVVRDCAIEATLRGLQLVGNQWNIISSRQYTTKEGFEYLIRRAKGVTDFKPVLGVPRSVNGGAIIECKATWQVNGKPQSLEASIPVKSDDYSGADQLLGKATRKFLKRCYEMMSGQSAPDGDVETDAITVSEVEAPPAVRIGRTTPAAPKPDDDDVPMDHPAPAAPTKPTPAATAPPKSSTPATAPAPAPEPPAPAPAPQAASETVQAKFAALIDAAGFAWPEVARCAPVLAWLDGADGRPHIDQVTGYGDIPAEIVAKLIGPNGAATGIIAALGRQRMMEESEAKPTAAKRQPR
jgi:hypothetical protein